jgi:hypothetical protein
MELGTNIPTSFLDYLREKEKVVPNMCHGSLGLGEGRNTTFFSEERGVEYEHK